MGVFRTEEDCCSCSDEEDFFRLLLVDRDRSRSFFFLSISLSSPLLREDDRPPFRLCDLDLDRSRSSPLCRSSFSSFASPSLLRVVDDLALDLDLDRSRDDDVVFSASDGFVDDVVSR